MEPISPTGIEEGETPGTPSGSYTPVTHPDSSTPGTPPRYVVLLPVLHLDSSTPVTHPDSSTPVTPSR
jgi:hypothetical protein